MGLVEIKMAFTDLRRAKLMPGLRGRGGGGVHFIKLCKGRLHHKDCCETFECL